MSKRASPSDDAAQGVALVAVILLALLDGAWLIAVLAAAILVLVSLALV